MRRADHPRRHVGTVEVQPVNSKFMRPFKTRDHPLRAAHGDGRRRQNPADPLEGHDHTQCRAFTDRLMHEIARLSEREYVDEYVPSRAERRSSLTETVAQRPSPSKQPVHIERRNVWAMAGYVVRIALPDRPGALGLVASRIGAVGGDIVAIHILEREDGQAVDEFVVELGGQHLIDSCAPRSTRWTAPPCSTSGQPDSTAPAG